MSEIKCNAIILKGSRKGELCNKKIRNNTQAQDGIPSISSVESDPMNFKCKLHVSTKKCSVLLVRGPRKNLLCNKNVFIDSDVYCKKHYFVEIKRPFNPYSNNEDNVINCNGKLVSNMCDTVFDYNELKDFYKKTDPILHFLAH